MKKNILTAILILIMLLTAFCVSANATGNVTVSDVEFRQNYAEVHKMNSGTITARVTLNNSTEEVQNGNLIFVLYNSDGRAYSVAYKNSDIQCGYNEIMTDSITVPENPPEYEAKVMVWDNNMAPILSKPACIDAEKSSDKRITSVSAAIGSSTRNALINEKTKEIVFYIETATNSNFGITKEQAQTAVDTAKAAFSPVITVANGAMLLDDTSQPRNLSENNKYTVQAEDGTRAVYTVSIETPEVCDGFIFNGGSSRVYTKSDGSTSYARFNTPAWNQYNLYGPGEWSKTQYAVTADGKDVELLGFDEEGNKILSGTIEKQSASYGYAPLVTGFENVKFSGDEVETKVFGLERNINSAKEYISGVALRYYTATINDVKMLMSELSFAVDYMHLTEGMYINLNGGKETQLIISGSSEEGKFRIGSRLWDGNSLVYHKTLDCDKLYTLKMIHRRTPYSNKSTFMYETDLYIDGEYLVTVGHQGRENTTSMEYQQIRFAFFGNSYGKLYLKNWKESKINR